MIRTVAEKMGIRANTRSYFANAPVDVLEYMDLPSLDISQALQGEFGYLHVFMKTMHELDYQFPKLKAHLSAQGTLWVSWPKNRQLGTDLTLPVVIKLGYSHGLIESTVLSIDKIWSAIRFTHPKPGKTYHNSYGTLPEHPKPQHD